MSDKLINDMLNRIAVLEKQVKKLQSNAAPTLPIYDSTNFPQDAVEGQVAIAPIV